MPVDHLHIQGVLFGNTLSEFLSQCTSLGFIKSLFPCLIEREAVVVGGIRMGISVGMAEYGYPGIIFAPANKIRKEDNNG